MKKQLLMIAAGLAMISLAGGAIASGTMPRPQRVPQAAASGDDAYARGKEIYMSKIACDSCPVAGGVDNKDAAMALTSRIDSGEFKLRSGEKRMVKAYLNNRFMLK